jgi:tetratricopeptide (TPR) repeat protein
MQLKKLTITILLSLLFTAPLLAQETDDPATNYKAAMALVDAGKGPEGIPYLEKVLKTQSAYTNAAYSLLGSIYDKNNQPDKAIAIYKDGLKAYPKDQNLYFNLGIADFRAKLYADAELAAIEAIKLDPKHANSQRLYGLVTFHQNKRLNALMAFCSFLFLEPNGSKSEEARTNLQSILKGGMLKGEKPVTGKAKSTDEKDKEFYNFCITVAITKGQNQNLTGTALLEYELKSIFIAAAKMDINPKKDFFYNFYVDFFCKLTQSGNVPGLAKLIANKDVDAKLMEWVKGAERVY